MMERVTIKFKSRKAAEEFAANFSILGEKTLVTVTESSVSVASENPRAVRFVKQTASELVEDFRCRAIATKMLSAISESVSTGKSKTVDLMDSTKQTITPRHAQVLASTYDQLNEENQAAFLVLAAESKDAYAHAVNFARTNEEMA